MLSDTPFITSLYVEVAIGPTSVSIEGITIVSDEEAFSAEADSEVGSAETTSGMSTLETSAVLSAGSEGIAIGFAISSAIV